MKITEQKLRQLIREEINNLTESVQVGVFGISPTSDEDAEKLRSIVKKYNGKFVDDAGRGTNLENYYDFSSERDASNFIKDLERSKIIRKLSTRIY